LPQITARKPARTSLRALLPLVPFALAYRGRLAAALVALVVASAATLLIPLAVRRVIDFGFSPDTKDLIGAYFGVLLGVVGLLALASACRFYLVMTLGERIVADVRTAVFAHLTRLDAGFYDAARSGEIVSRLTADTTQIKSAFGASASVALRNVFLFLGAVIMMVATSPKLSAIVLVAIPIIVLPLVGAGRSVRERSRAAQDALAETSAFATEQLGAHRTMVAFGAEERTRSRFSAAVEDAYTAARQSMVARSLLTAVALFLIFASVIGVLWLGAQDVISGEMTAGRLSQFILYAVFAASSLSQLSEVWSEISSAAGAAGRLSELIATEPQVKAPLDAAPAPAVTGRIAFEHVSFAYPTAPEVPVLTDLSLAIRPGERVAVVGPSGAGKSTIFQLLMRFYDPTAGRITLEGEDVRTLAPDALRAAMALVSQEPAIFSGTISDNIRYARPAASDAEVRAAAEQAAAHGFISALPQGYDTWVGERGITLSGGERQRVAIARAILKDAPILLLDEATSALDAENEAAVQTALDRLMQGRTTLVIAHRLATVLSADRILVLSDGRIVEEGTHGTLAGNGGLYARLAALQFQRAEAA
jgi:ATP-binding cassette subfamily B protein